MSKLDELIKEYCPDGVKYCKIKDNYTRLRGTPITAGKMKEIEKLDGDIRVFAGGKTIIDAFEVEIPNANITRKPAVLVQSRGVIDVIYYEQPFTFKNEMWAYTHKNKTATKYLFYVLKNNLQKFRDSASGMGSLPQISLKVTEDFVIPIPPLPVQEEIVRILDNFTELTTELTTELAARKKQYEYYRDSLLINEKRHKRVLLKTIVKKSCSGGTPNKGKSEFYENGTIPWLRTQEVKFNEIFEINSFITEEAVKKTSAKWIPMNCVIVAISGATAGRCAINKIPTTTNQHCYNMEIDENKALYKFVYYCICSQHKELLSRKQGARGDLNSSLVMGIEIPLPTLEEQQHIVDILDRFDTICNDISVGLPAEINARQQQYEYYRDKLLSFPNIDNKEI